ncbi:MAG TPA: SAM-dependent methyltransferase, partial [Acidimicrobiales bacterium]|nr:SAM-dependent methyltransferase [Acidimicrobiales bacterium]
MTLPTVVVVGLGPAGPDLLTERTIDAIDAAGVRYVRTNRHPSASVLEGATSFDHHYEEASTIEEVYAAIVEDLVAAAAHHGRVLYAVPGSPAVGERTVELLRADPRVQCEVVPALSAVDLAWACLGVDPLAAGARIVDGHRFAVEAAGDRGPLLVLQCDSREVLSAIKLAVEDGPPVTVL